MSSCVRRDERIVCSWMGSGRESLSFVFIQFDAGGAASATCRGILFPERMWNCLIGRRVALRLPSWLHQIRKMAIQILICPASAMLQSRATNHSIPCHGSQSLKLYSQLICTIKEDRGCSRLRDARCGAKDWPHD